MIKAGVITWKPNSMMPAISPRNAPQRSFSRRAASASGRKFFLRDRRVASDLEGDLAAGHFADAGLGFLEFARSFTSLSGRRLASQVDEKL